MSGVPAVATSPSVAKRHALIFCAIVAITAAVHARAVWCDFSDADDFAYVTENPHVLGGLTADGAVWACTTLNASNWHPLTWLSLQLDVSLWGADAFGFHFTNVLLHALTAGFFFVVLAGMTGSPERSAVVALLFAVHPLRVESVAWISERKDVLSGLLWVLTMLAYAWYAGAPSWRRMMVVTGVFALGLSAKPMLVTLPCVLVLLDFWPLARIRTRAEFLQRIGEKWPLWILVVGSAVVTVYAQAHGGAVRDLTQRSVMDRVSGASVAYLVYLRKTFGPVDLGIFYPHPSSPRPLWQLAAALGAIAAISTAAVLLRRRAPYLLVGWLWYLGTLVPVIGLIQVGEQAYADRYTYIPHMGLWLALVWGVADLLSCLPGGYRWGLRLAAGAVIVLGIATRDQISHWQDKKSLWAHTLTITEDNGVAHHRYGALLARDGKFADAMPHLDRAVELLPEQYPPAFARASNLARLGRFAEAEPAALHALQLAGTSPRHLAECWYLLGNISQLQGNVPEAIARYQHSLGYNAQQPDVRNNYAIALDGLGRTDEAIAVLMPAVEQAPNHSNAVGNLGMMLLKRNRFAEAVPYLRQACKIAPKHPGPREQLALVLFALGQRDEAVKLAREVAQIDPQWLPATAQSAWVLATHKDAIRRDGSAAIRLAELVCACVMRPSPALLDVLAAAYAEGGRYDEAATLAERAADAAERAGQPQLAEAMRARVGLYRKQQPYRAP